MSFLTEDQAKRIEEKKKLALQIKALKFGRKHINDNEQIMKINISSIKEDECQQKKINSGIPMLKDLNLSEQAGISTSNCQNGTCYMISTDRFSVAVTYNKKLIDLFKLVKSSRYDANRREWNFHITEYTTLMDMVKPLASSVTLTGLPKIVLETFRDDKSCRVVTDEELSRIDPQLMCHLMPFQLDAVRFGVSKEGRCLIADDMGLGKTIEALAIADFYRSDWPLLIVCPSSVRFDWLSAIDTWLPTVKPHQVHVMVSGKDHVESDVLVVIISYDLLARHGERLATRLPFRAVIMDESHYLKNFKSGRTRAGVEMLARARRVLLLSGTPALSRPSELYTQISAIEPKAFKGFHEFGVRYCDAQKRVFGWDYSGSSNMEELHQLLAKRFMIRRLKEDVLSELPAKRREVLVLDSTLVAAGTDHMDGCLQAFSAKGLKPMERRGALLSYYNATGKAKLPAVLDYVARLLEQGRKFICFAHHQCVLDAICRAIDASNHRYVRIDGSTGSEERKRRCDQFQFDESVVVAVLSITAAYTGITLTAAQFVIFAELFWNPGILMQAEDRAHRLGQKGSVEVQYLVAQGTADDHLWALLQDKLDVLNKAGLSHHNLQQSSVCRQSQVTPHEGSRKRQKTLMEMFTGPGAGAGAGAETQEELWEDEAALAKLDVDGIAQAELSRLGS